VEYVFIFKSTNFAIKAERCLLGQKLHVTVMPLPSQIRAGCGICLRVSQKDMELARGTLLDEGVDGVEVYSRVEEDGKFVYSEVKGA